MAWELYDSKKHKIFRGETKLRLAPWSHFCKLAGEKFETCSGLSYKGSRHRLADLQSSRPNGSTSYTVDGDKIRFTNIGSYQHYGVHKNLIEIWVKDKPKPKDTPKEKDMAVNYNKKEWQQCNQNTMLTEFDRVRLPLREELRRKFGINSYNNLNTSKLDKRWISETGATYLDVTESSYKKIRKGQTLMIRKIKDAGSIDTKNRIAYLAGTYGDIIGIPFEYLEFYPADKSEDQRKVAYGLAALQADRETTPTPTKKTKEEKTMLTPNFNAKAILDQNKDALVLAAKIEVGEAAVKQVSKIVRKQLPMMVRGYAELPVFDILVANLVVMAIKQFAPDNEKAQIIADAMLLAAMQKQMKEFNIPQMVDEFVSGIDVSAITRLEAPKDAE